MEVEIQKEAGEEKQEEQVEVQEEAGEEQGKQLEVEEADEEEQYSQVSVGGQEETGKEKTNTKPKKKSAGYRAVV